MQSTNINCFVFNNDDNGGESLSLTTFKHVDDRYPTAGAYITQELTLQSYGNSASFNIGYFFTPENLRKLADALDSQL